MHAASRFFGRKKTRLRKETKQRESTVVSSKGEHLRWAKLASAREGSLSCLHDVSATGRTRRDSPTWTDKRAAVTARVRRPNVQPAAMQAAKAAAVVYSAYTCACDVMRSARRDVMTRPKAR